MSTSSTVPVKWKGQRCAGYEICVSLSVPAGKIELIYAGTRKRRKNGWYDTFFMGKQIPSDNFIILRWLKSGGGGGTTGRDNVMIILLIIDLITTSKEPKLWRSPLWERNGAILLLFSVPRTPPPLHLALIPRVFLSLEISISRMSSPLCDFHGCFLITLWTRTRPEPHDEIIIITVTIQSVFPWP